MDSAEHRKKLETVFDKASEGYDLPALRFFADSASLLINGMRLKGNEAMLDAATGTGHVAVAAARELSSGNVTGIDISDGMLKRARGKADRLGLTNITFSRRGIEDMGFPENSFDLASCAFGLFFLPDMASGLRSIFRVIKPGGKLHLTSFRAGLMEPMRGMLLSRLKSHGIEPPEFTSRLDSPDKIVRLLQGAGGRDIRVRSKQLGYYIKDGREWLDVLLNTAFGGPLARVPEKDLAPLLDSHLREVEGLRTEDGIWLNVEVLFTETGISRS
ncbi:MAG: class I SAM-dependent methyltransferase [Nitrospirota bacterium]